MGALWSLWASLGGRWIREFIAPRGGPRLMDSAIEQGNRV
jgi:hypothetical protein